MCGRYTYYSTEEIVKEFNLLPEPQRQQALDLDIPDNYNVAPGQTMPVLVRGEQAHEIDMMVWGLIPAWAKQEKQSLKLINARKEGLFEKPMWNRLVKAKRCVVPARGFYEWKNIAGSKLPYYITPTSGKVFSFAGLWDEWVNKSGEKIKSYTIITTTPNKEMSEIHNRMPVILKKDVTDIWLSPLELSQDQVDDILTSAPNGSLNIVRVSNEVNSTRHNSKELIYPLTD